MSLLKKIFWIIMTILLILAVLVLSFMMAQKDNASTKCAKEYGGKVVQGYCTYVEDGNSKSFNIWDIKQSKEKLK